VRQTDDFREICSKLIAKLVSFGRKIISRWINHAYELLDKAKVLDSLITPANFMNEAAEGSLLTNIDFSFCVYGFWSIIAESDFEEFRKSRIE